MDRLGYLYFLEIIGALEARSKRLRGELEARARRNKLARRATHSARQVFLFLQPTSLDFILIIPSELVAYEAAKSPLIDHSDCIYGQSIFLPPP